MHPEPIAHGVAIPVSFSDPLVVLGIPASALTLPMQTEQGAGQALLICA